MAGRSVRGWAAGGLRCVLVLVLVGIASALHPPLVGAATVVATVFSDPAPGACAASGTGNCSLREAVVYANTHANTTITLLAGTYTLTRGRTDEYDAVSDASRGSLYLRNSGGVTTIAGAGAGSTTIDAAGMTPTYDRVFTVDTSNPYGTVAVRMSGVTVRGGRANVGGGVYVSQWGDLALTDSAIRNNLLGSGTGGGMFAGGKVALTRVQVVGNHSVVATEGFGGGISVGGAYNAVTITDSVLSGNQASAGGALLHTGNPLSITGTTIEGNRATTDGGGIYNQRTLTLSGTRVVGNIAGRNGGGIENDGTLTVDASTVGGNEARGTATYSSRNSDGGGGIYNAGGVVAVVGSAISDNRATVGGGGIYGIYGSLARVSVTGSTVSGNMARHGGGLFTAGELALTNVTVSGNIANGSTPQEAWGLAGDAGGAIFNLSDGNPGGGRTSLTNVTAAANSSGVAFGVSPNAAMADRGSVTVRNTLLDNVSRNCAGAALTSGDYNLSRDPACAASLSGAHDRTGVDPLIAPLADNGGTAANGCPATDQRGTARPQGAACDIGAFEATAFPASAPSVRQSAPSAGLPSALPQRQPGPPIGGAPGVPTPNAAPTRR